MLPSQTAAATRPDAAAASRRGLWSGLDQASVMGTELLSAIITWTLIGWLVDRWLGTEPWFIVVGALLGNAAGIYLVWLRSSRMEGFAPVVTPDPGDDETGPTPADEHRRRAAP